MVAKKIMQDREDKASLSRRLIISIILAVLFLIILIVTFTSPEYKPIIFKADLPMIAKDYSHKLHLKDIKSSRINNFHFQEEWTTLTPGEQKKNVKKRHYVLVVRRNYHLTRKNAEDFMKSKRSFFTYKFLPNSPSGRKYGDESIYFIAENNPDLRSLIFLNDKTVVEIRGSGIDSINREPLRWEFMEYIARLVESRL